MRRFAIVELDTGEILVAVEVTPGLLELGAAVCTATARRLDELGLPVSIVDVDHLEGRST